jgi:hypothetical protein
VAHQALQDRLAGCESFRRRLRGLEVRAFSGQRAPGGGHFGGLGRGEVCRAPTGWRAGAVVAAGRAVVAAGRAVIAAGRAVAIRSILASRRSGVASRGGVAWPIVAGPIVAPGRAVVTPGRAVAIWSILAWSIAHGPIVAWAILAWAWRRRGERHGRCGVALRGGATKGGAWGGYDPGRLRAHAQDAPTARGQDLEVEVVELGTKRLASEAQGFLDGLASEFLVFAHQRRLPRRP